MIQCIHCGVVIRPGWANCPACGFSFTGGAFIRSSQCGGRRPALDCSSDPGGTIPSTRQEYAAPDAGGYARISVARSPSHHVGVPRTMPPLVVACKLCSDARHATDSCDRFQTILQRLPSTLWSVDKKRNGNRRLEFHAGLASCRSSGASHYTFVLDFMASFGMSSLDLHDFLSVTYERKPTSCQKQQVSPLVTWSPSARYGTHRSC